MTMLDIMAIPLTRGLYALVDGEDYLRLSQWKWCAYKDKRNNYYAVRRVLVKDAPGPKSHSISMHRVILDSPSNMDTHHNNECGHDYNGVSCRAGRSTTNEFILALQDAKAFVEANK